MGKQWKQWQTIFLGSKITADGDCSHEIKRCLLLGSKAMTNLDRVLRSRDSTLLIKVHMVFSCGHVWMWELDHKEYWASKNWCFQTVMLEKTLESCLDHIEIKSINPKGNQSWIFIGKNDAKAESPTSGPLIRRVNSLENTLVLGKIEGRGEGGGGGWDD